ncbi:MAG: hypothetical protein IJI05_00450 [Erysipelotrichaceae bacterium]|nr:hypothetical protein [Erysipelotrichaceae bacterium]
MWQKVREYTHPEGKTQYFYTTDVIPDYDTGLDKMLAIINKTSTGPGSYSLKLVGFGTDDGKFDQLDGDIKAYINESTDTLIDFLKRVNAADYVVFKGDMTMQDGEICPYEIMMALLEEVPVISVFSPILPDELLQQLVELL